MTTVCLANIGPRERSRRTRFGAISLVAGVLLAVVLIGLSVARPWRLVAFVPLWVGALGIIQAREKTCVALVARGECNLDGGVEAVSDPSDLAQLKAQALRVYVTSLIVAAVLSAAAFAVP